LLFLDLYFRNFVWTWAESFFLLIFLVGWYFFRWLDAQPSHEVQRVNKYVLLTAAILFFGGMWALIIVTW